MAVVADTALPPARIEGGSAHRGGLPQPPDDQQRDSYLGPQQRWTTCLSLLGTGLTLLSVWFFVARRLWAAGLLLPLAVTAAAALTSFVTTVRRRRDSLAGHRGRVRDWQPERVPSVDVFLPSAGEPLDVLANTYLHVSRLIWAGRCTVYVLDDSGRDEVRDLAEVHGFRYLSRPDRGHLKKAGNLRYGFAQSDGELIALLDADFVPRPDFLAELAPYFDEPDIGIVQSPQYFDINGDMNWVQHAAGATQILFYRWVQPSRDRSDASICVGTCAVYRRAALDAAGGFAAIGHSEDVHTGVRCIAAGYRVRYVPTVVSKGLCPDDLGQFLTQQYRWCLGSMSLLGSRSFHRTAMTPGQRLSYWAGFLYYISTAIDVLAVSVPPVLMAAFSPAQVRPSNYIFVLLALVFRLAVVPYITLGRDSMLSLTRIQTAYAFAHALAIFDVVRGRTDGWVATGTAARSRTSIRALRLIRVWFVLTQVLLWTLIAVRAPAFGWSRFLPMAAFALLNAVVVLPLAVGRSELPAVLDPMTPRRRLGLVGR